MTQIKLYTKSYCPFCKKTLALFEELNVSYENYIIDEKSNGEEEYQKIKEKTGKETVPQIFINHKFIGGYDELFELKNSGDLDKILKN